MASSETDDLNKCRLCLKTGEFSSIFSSFPGSVPYFEIAMGCSNVQILKGDGLPDKICEECIDKLNFIYTFKKECERCDAQLRMSLPKKIYEIEFLPLNCNNLEVEMASEIEPCENLLEERYSVNDLPTSATNEVKVYPILKNKKSHLAEDDYHKCPLKCSVCKRIFDNIYGFSAHKKIHMRKSKSCNEALPKPIKMKVASMMSNNFTCNLCEKEIKGIVMYRMHLHICKLKSKASTLGADVIIKHLVENSCPVCKSEFKKRSTLKQHFKSPCGYAMKTRIRELKGDVTYNITDVERIILEISQVEKTVQCSNCKEMFETYSLLLCHFRQCLSSKGIIEISCKECKLVFSNRMQFVRHIKSSHISILGSPVTNVNTYRRSSLSTRKNGHQDNELKDIANQCNHCLNSFDGEELLSIHLAHYCRYNNILRKKPTCHICFKTYSLSVQLNCHLKIQHSMDTPNTPFFMKPPVCDFCFTTFKDRIQMLSHRNLHFSRESYLCKVCNTQMAKYMLQRHTYKHVRHIYYNPINCEQCEEKFTALSTLKIHSQTVHQKEFELFVFCDIEKNYEICPICNKIFPSHFISRHINFHENYKCNKCFEYFFSEIIFQKHNCNQINEPEKAIQVPTKSDPVEEFDTTDIYDCEFCFRSISNRYKISHSERHFRPMQYGCILCYKKFSSKAPLNQHTLFHQNYDYTMNPLVCRHCGETFVRFNSYSDHVLDVHNAPENIVVPLEFPPQPCLICHKTFPFIHRHYKYHKDTQCSRCKKYFLSTQLFSKHICNNVSEDPTLAVTFAGDISNLLKPNCEFHHEKMIIRKYSLEDPLRENNLDPISCVEISLNPTADDTSYDDFLPKISSIVSLTEIKQEADSSLNMNTIEIKDEPINDGYDYSSFEFQE